MAENNSLIIFAISLLVVVITFLLILHVERKIKGKRFCRPFFFLKRHPHNPIMSPQFIREWEHGGTFNPAAIIDNEDAVHLLYRAVGADGISRIGYALSKDGKHIDLRSQYPVFEPQRGYGLPDSSKITGPKTYNPAFYTSGGGWAGSEDPRAVLINNTVYMSYVAFEGWNSVRIALTSIKLDDLKKQKWNWKRPTMISAPGQPAKNWVIFPEKINGKFAILHSIVPTIGIEYVDSIDSITKHIESPRLQGPQPGRKGFWDNRVRGAGPPPLKTDIGWLLLYHANDQQEPHKYKLGVMILDKNDPTKILYRSPQPILEPDSYYENDGKPGIVYASGAVILKNQLIVYYGGGDRHVCIAETPLPQLLEWLKINGKVN